MPDLSSFEARCLYDCMIEVIHKARTHLASNVPAGCSTTVNKKKFGPKKNLMKPHIFYTLDRLSHMTHLLRWPFAAAPLQCVVTWNHLLTARQLNLGLFLAHDWPLAVKAFSFKENRRRRMFAATASTDERSVVISMHRTLKKKIKFRH